MQSAVLFQHSYEGPGEFARIGQGSQFWGQGKGAIKWTLDPMVSAKISLGRIALRIAGKPRWADLPNENTNGHQPDHRCTDSPRQWAQARQDSKAHRRHFCRYRYDSYATQTVRASRGLLMGTIKFPITKGANMQSGTRHR